MLQTIDFSLPKIKPKYYLAKPNKEIISVLDVFADTYNPKLGGISELNFSISLMREINHEWVINPNYSKIKDFYLVKLVLGNTEEWFLINNITKSMKQDDTKIVHAFSLGFELSRKRIRDYNVVSYNPQMIFDNILDNTSWTIGYINPIFLTRYRSLETSGTKTVLELVIETANTFQGLLYWDTVNRKISLYDLDELSENKGLRFSLGNLLQGIEEISDSDQMVTRLYPYGQNGLTINSVCLNSYIEDFSYFMTTDYMSQGLITALQDYAILVNSKQSEYTSLLSDKADLQETLTTQKNALDSLQTEWTIITDNLYMAQNSGQNTTTLLAQQSAKSAEISAQQALVDETTSDIADIDAQMLALQSEVAIENNFTAEQIEERKNFIIEKDWQNEFLFTAKDLYDSAIVEFQKMREPALSVKIEVVNFLSVLSEQKKWNHLVMGDIVQAYHPTLDINIQAKLTEIQFDFQNETIGLSITNAKQILNDKEKFLNNLQQSMSTSTTVTSNKHNWSAALQAGNGIIADNNNMIVEINTSEESGVVVKSADGRTQLLDKGLSVFSVSGVHELVKVGDVSETQNGTVYGIVGRDISGNELFRLDCASGLTISQDGGRVKLTGKGLIVYDTDKVTVKLRVGDISEAQDGSEYGLKIYNANGDVVLSNSGAIQSYSFSQADNVGNGFPLKIKFYIPPETLEIKNVKLAFSLEAFRAYETGAASGGGGATTSADSGGSTTTSGGDHNHLMFRVNSAYTSDAPYGVQLIAANSALKLEGITCSDVSGDFYTRGSSGNHSHTAPVHSHSVSLPPHTHPIEYGIYTGGQPSDIDVKVNGVTRLSNNGSHYNSDQSDLELAQWIQSGWNSIELTSTSLGRIAASVYIKSYISH